MVTNTGRHRHTARRASLQPPIEVLLLDVDGVVLNDPFDRFLDRVAELCELYPSEIRHRWRSEVAEDALLGRLDDARLWKALAPEASMGAEEGLSTLESMYDLGPASDALRRWRRFAPIWLMANDRSDRLWSRLERFGLASHVSQVLVSDEVGAIKPSPEAFAPVLQRVSNPAAVLYVDNEPRNVTAARRHGMRAVLAFPEDNWVRRVNRILAGGTAPQKLEVVPARTSLAERRSA